MVQLSHPYMTKGNIITLTIQTFVSKVMSLLFNMLSRFVIAFFSRSKCLLISWLHSLSSVISEPKKTKSATVFTFPYLFSMKWWDWSGFLVEKTTRPFKYDLNQIPYDYIVEVRNRFKGLDLIDRVPDELWMEVCDIVQETGIKTIPKKKKCKRAKWFSEEALQIAVERREVKGKGRKERYTHLNAEFQRITRRDKKAFFSEQCKEKEENNRMGKTRDLFKKIRDTKGTFHAKMGLIKDWNGRT